MIEDVVAAWVKKKQLPPAPLGRSPAAPRPTGR